MLNFKEKSQDDNKRFTETIDERVHRHLRDKNDVITDDDIRNARVVLDIKTNAYEDFLAQLTPLHKAS